MRTKAKAPPRTPAPAPPPDLGLWPTPPWTLEERVRHIEAMGQRIDGFIRFMCQAPTMTGASGEAKERAVKAFYERLVIVETQLGRIHDELRLG